MSGISPEHSEIDEALLDLIQRFDEADNERKKETAGKKSKMEEELVKAQEIRKMSLETFGESRKRKGDTEGQGKRSRRSSSDTLSFLAEKIITRIYTSTGRIEIEAAVTHTTNSTNPKLAADSASSICYASTAKCVDVRNVLKNLITTNSDCIGLFLFNILLSCRLWYNALCIKCSIFMEYGYIIHGTKFPSEFTSILFYIFDFQKFIYKCKTFFLNLNYFCLTKIKKNQVGLHKRYSSTWCIYYF